MSDTARSAQPVDLAALIPAQRAPEPGPVVAVPGATSPGPDRLAFLWTMLGALAGAAIVAVAFLVLLTLLP